MILSAGEKPVQLTVENGVGVRVKTTIEIKRVDGNFSED